MKHIGELLCATKCAAHSEMSSTQTVDQIYNPVCDWTTIWANDWTNIVTNEFITISPLAENTLESIRYIAFSSNHNFSMCLCDISSKCNCSLHTALTHRPTTTVLYIPLWHTDQPQRFSISLSDTQTNHNGSLYTSLTHRPTSTVLYTPLSHIVQPLLFSTHLCLTHKRSGYHVRTTEQ